MQRKIQRLAGLAEPLSKAECRVVVILGIVTARQTTGGAADSARRESTAIELAVGAQSPTLHPVHGGRKRLKLVGVVLARKAHGRNLAANVLARMVLAGEYLACRRVRPDH